jgi:DNA adenine methylase
MYDNLRDFINSLFMFAHKNVYNVGWYHICAICPILRSTLRYISYISYSWGTIVGGENFLAINRKRNRAARKIEGVPRPFLKWAGGKRQLIPQIDTFLPPRITEYVEPFVGGGALFFYILPERAVLIDNNAALINVYQVIKENVDGLIELLRHHKNEKEYYYHIRGQDRLPEFAQMTLVERASRLIYLNRCCYNGLYRVNSKGQFNVPFGKYKNPNYCDEPNLRAVHVALQNVELVHGPFEEALRYATSESFVYLDPPYAPMSTTANFTSYTKDNFDFQDQQRLRQMFDKLTDLGAKAMLSNSYNEAILDLYHDYRIEVVGATRAINSDASKRGKVKEVLVLNY